MIKMIIAMIMAILITLKNSNLLHISSKQSGKTFKWNPFLYIQFKNFKSFQLFKFHCLNTKSLDLEKIALQCRGR